MDIPTTQRWPPARRRDTLAVLERGVWRRFHGRRTERPILGSACSGARPSGVKCRWFQSCSYRCGRLEDAQARRLTGRARRPVQAPPPDKLCPPSGVGPARGVGLTRRMIRPARSRPPRQGGVVPTSCGQLAVARKRVSESCCRRRLAMQISIASTACARLRVAPGNCVTRP